MANTKKLLKPEKQCPECKGVIDWKVIRGDFGKSMYSGLCKKCNIVLKGRETPDLKKGRLLTKDIGVVKWNDKRLTKFNADVQIGYFRQIQHCATCGKPWYPITKKSDDCLCKKCDCLYCREYRIP